MRSARSLGAFFKLAGAAKALYAASIRGRLARVRAPRATLRAALMYCNGSSANWQHIALIFGLCKLVTNCAPANWLTRLGHFKREPSEPSEPTQRAPLGYVCQWQRL